ncbi:MAG: ABC transporter permease [Desulfovibrio sp.]|uniref:ABC transporter permease n=1 Tax=Desulfovibrio sp. 7SRBS1 TaxID=3378064 RepID=UPI003B3E7215
MSKKHLIYNLAPFHGNTKSNARLTLPFAKSVSISLKSLRVRFFRSLLTVMTLVLAVAFLGFTLSGGTIAQGVLDSGVEGLRLAVIRAGFDIDPLTGIIGSTAKDRWIILLSLLVCTVGIVNAQLMAVTERFREIGTMKCLGALDSFVLRLFLLEAGFQGFAGSLAGSLLGGLAALAISLIRFGTAALTNLPVGTFCLSLLTATGVGLGLSLVGVLYPAIVAAKMQPVDAMRSEG